MIELKETDNILVKKKAILANVLACPICQGDLDEKQDHYSCRKCQKSHSIRDGIPRFLTMTSKNEEQVKNSFNLQHFRYLDSRYLHFTPELVDQWLNDVQLPKDYFKGKLVLDAGCGTGRWTYAMALLGATVVAIDFTDAGVSVTQKGTGHLENVAVLQASIFDLPFRPDTFDFVLSWGVLHHTPNTKVAFDRLVPLVKKGGQLYVMVYERHNPLKFLFTDLLRRILRSVSEEQRYRLCTRFIIKSPRLYRWLSKGMICACYPENADPLQISTIQLGLYDAYSPGFNHLHTRKEVEGWFQEHRFGDMFLTKPIRHKRKRDIFFLGECGGSVNMRGVRA